MTTKTSQSDRNSKSELFGSGGKSGGKAGGKQGKAGARKGGPKKGKPVAAVKAGKDRNWGPIAMFTVVGLLAVGIIGYAFFQQRSVGSAEWREQAAEIEGILDHYSENPDIAQSEDYRRHVTGTVDYETSPPTYGAHNDIWQNCQGDVYPAPIANEHAVHSLEHGAIWITYHPELASERDVNILADMVEGTEKMFMSPYPDLDAPISLQAWGYQLKVDGATDSRINEFIRTLRVNTSLEGPTAACSNGVTTTGTTPINATGGM